MLLGRMNAVRQENQEQEVLLECRNVVRKDCQHQRSLDFEAAGAVAAVLFGSAAH